MPSNVIKKFSYNTEQMVLTVMFVSGKVYDYFQVPYRIFDGFKTSFSKGSFLNRNIKGKFRFKERTLIN